MGPRLRVKQAHEKASAEDGLVERNKDGKRQFRNGTW
jgi:hypothetical protein